MITPKEEKNVSDSSDSYVVASVDRAAALLLTLAEMPESGITELSVATGATKSLTFRLLYTLERRGLVRKDAERRRYSLGYRALLFGDQSRRQSPLIGAAEPILKDLSDTTQENALLLVREGLNSICIALKESPQPLRIFASVGRLGPLYAGGGPKILLAFAPGDVQRLVLAQSLTQFTDDTVKSPDVLADELAEIRRRGVVGTMGEIDLNTFSIAAPVRDHTGVVIAAISINGPSVRLDDAARARGEDAVLTSANALSRQLGWNGVAVEAGT